MKDAARKVASRAAAGADGAAAKGPMWRQIQEGASLELPAILSVEDSHGLHSRPRIRTEAHHSASQRRHATQGETRRFSSSCWFSKVADAIYARRSRIYLRRERGEGQ
eukprot:scaffold32376_cov68-Phaeocystis_antarctica.AAC.2